MIAHQSKQKSLVCHVLHGHILILLDVMSIERQLSFSLIVCLCQVVQSGHTEEGVVMAVDYMEEWYE